MFAKSEMLECSRCGGDSLTQVSEGVFKCDYCGALYYVKDRPKDISHGRPSATPPSSSTGQRPGSSSRGGWRAGGLLFFLVVGLGLWLFVTHQRPKPNRAHQTKTDTSNSDPRHPPTRARLQSSTGEPKKPEATSSDTDTSNNSASNNSASNNSASNNSTSNNSTSNNSTSGTAASEADITDSAIVESAIFKKAKVRAQSPKVRGALDKEIIQRIISRNMGEVKRCYVGQLVSHPKLEGRVVIRFVVSPSGRVATASVARSTLHSRAVESCIATAVERWRFPKPRGGGIVVVSYPFVFKAH